MSIIMFKNGPNDIGLTRKDKSLGDHMVSQAYFLCEEGEIRPMEVCVTLITLANASRRAR